MSRFADVTSDTPHGPRPVPEGHIPSGRLPPSRRLPPPEEKRPSLAVLGGMGVAAAAATALTIFAGRAVAGAISGDDEDRPRRRSRPRRRHAPRFEELSLAERQAMLNRARADFVDYDEHAADLRRRAAQPRPRPRPAGGRRPSQGHSEGGFLRSFGDSAGEIATNLTRLVAAATAAVQGFQQVSGRADGILRDFMEASDKFGGLFGGKGGDGDDTRTSHTPAQKADQTDTASAHRSAENEATRRSHNL
ncbi:hypothetical protein [Paracoccus sediminicola]|uniref:hypothetical protein n=1 Tax=Paracoccus sediminicola TaxID=3017783 RepID=UPI0022EFE90E|nr:hypothetical protein [Paracoccus sediminicola]WBU57313.1 hypothetical protein PAF18_02365 [Paracoccus sediminicola]